MTRTLHVKMSAMGLLLIASVLVFAACSDDSGPKDVQFDLAIQDGAINLDPPVMKVSQGDNVTFNIDSDEMGSFHLHGYDFETDVGPSETAALAFTANATGKFPFTFHGGSHEEEGEGIDLVTHGAFFESETLEEGDSFSLGITHELEGKTVVFHNHMDHEKTGMIMISEDGAESGTVQVRLLEDSSFEPVEISARPGATVIWTNASTVAGRVVSGPPPGGDHEDEHEEEEHEDEHEDEEEITLGSLEVHPR